MTTLLITGPPRGGTTLACELLNRLPDARALDEPLKPARLIREATRPDGSLDHELIISGIRAFAAEQRRSLLEKGVAVTKHVEGRVSGAKFSDEREPDGRRRRLRSRGEVYFGVPSAADFTLAIKHPVAFTALLDVLLPAFPIAALVRNPLAVVASWETVPLAVRDGETGMGTAAAPALARRLAVHADRLDRQVELLAWFYERYREGLPADRVIRYEQIVATGGAALAAVVASARCLDVPLVSRNAATTVYDAGHMKVMADRLLARDPGQWAPYRHEDIQQLLKVIDT